MVENKEVQKYNLVQVPTQHVLAIETPEKDVISTEQAIVEILNELKEIKILVG